MNKEICRLCSGSNLKNFNIGGHELVLCISCKIVYNKSFKDYLDDIEYYQNQYYLTKNKPYSEETRRIFRLPEQIKLIAAINHFRPEKGKILDFGCDRGYFLDEARRYGFQVAGVEQSTEALKYSNNIGLDVRPNLHDFEIKFDIITMWHSLEHLSQPKQILEDFKKFLNDKGLLFIRVPDFGSMPRKIFGKKWIWFQPENHYFHYNLQSLRFLLENSGYEILFLQSQKPNNITTKRMYRLTNSIFADYFRTDISFRERLSQKYQDMTGYELFAIAQKKN